MKLCGKLMPKAKNGTDRGLCTRLCRHTGLHGNKTCPDCGAKLVMHSSKSRGNGCCGECSTKKVRLLYGHAPAARQKAGQGYSFPCGCGGVLPNEARKGNQLAVWTGFNWWCRVSHILSQSRNEARRWKHRAISPDTPHWIIRQLMLQTHCERCGQPLSWRQFGNGRTPHLHHNHETGEIYGFTHPVCNPRALEREIQRLRNTVKELSFEA
jgi:hypothetical protein